MLNAWISALCSVDAAWPLVPRFDIVLISRVALYQFNRAQTGIGVGLLPRPSVGLSVCSVGELWKNGCLDLAAVCGGELDRSPNGCIRWAGDGSRGRGNFGGEYGASHCN